MVTDVKYLIVVEKTDTGFSAYAPGLPGCMAAATRDEVEQLMSEAMEFHLEGLGLEGNEPPPSRSYSLYVEL